MYAIESVQERPVGTGSLSDTNFESSTLSEAQTVSYYDFPNFVDRIASSCNLDEKTRLAILDFKYSDKGCEEVQAFRSEIGQTGHCVYGYVKTRNTPCGMDVAYSVCVVRFKLSPIKVRMEKKTKLFGLFTIWTTRWYEYRSRSLTRSEEDAIRKYAREAACEGLRVVFRKSGMLAIE